MSLNENRIDNCLSDLKLQNKKALMGAIVPDVKKFDEDLKNVLSLADAGLDIIQIKVPFSDPLADGPIVQILATRAVANHTGTDDVFRLVNMIRKASPKMPVVISAYFNTLSHYGISKFLDNAVENGVDGIIVPDLPCEECGELPKQLRKGILLIQNVTPYSADKVEEICRNSEGFLIIASTRADTDAVNEQMNSFSEVLNKYNKLPVFSNSDVSSSNDARKIAVHFDGLILSSFLMTILEEKGTKEAENFVREIKAVM